MKKLISVVLLTTCPCLLSGQVHNKYDVIRLEIGGQFGALINRNPINTFNTMPAPLRTVQWHPDDDFCKCHTTTIPYDSVNPGGVNSSYDLTGTVGLVIRERIAFRGGLNYLKGYLHETLNTNNAGRIREADISQNTYIRGYGTSLVYYAVMNNGWTRGIAPFGEVELSVNDWLGIVAGGSSHGLAYEIQRGYDRYDAFQTLDRVPFVTMQVYQPYLGVHMGARFNLEANENRPNSTSFGAYLTAGPTFLQTLHFAPAAQGAATMGGLDGVSIRVGVYFNYALIRLGLGKSQR